ncbi:hypothetical protein N7468_006735 [Penicillium chermesinum]|uniref:Zn(2)-C6 fungal-type domain-containing protein n=1 Tax=Penicillium chermesinum TaxID=63820 RepID=A0A9W9NSR6_9EURO|nr:uncharacterized protein N7468_006735 [Penicillium chermesinum]KAJ5225510.1 hypothetical protein N7468_006735 [Penicillium chermesinum]KAJ6161265.1 hypothetical protein N7470_004661 [Penicillium chermesinum]
MDTRTESTSNPRKRRRPALSCEQCRRRKVRCDREMPCGPCTKSQPPLDCEYVNEGKAALDARLDSRSAEQESSCIGVSQAGSTSDGARITQLERTVQALQARVRDLEKSKHREAQEDKLPAKPFDNHLPRLAGEPDHTSTKSPPTCIPPLNPRLNSTPDSMKVFGTTHWALVFQQLRLLRQVRSTASYTDGEKNEMSKSLKEIRTIRQRIKNHQAPRLEEPVPGLLKDVPGKDVCDQLVQHYFRTLGLIYRVIHSPTFFQEYNTFWEQPQNVSTSFLLQLLLILAIGSVFHCKPGPFNELGLPIRRWIYAAKWWLEGPGEREAQSMAGLQVQSLVIVCRQAYAIHKETNWVMAGALLRRAINQGLHRDPKNFPTISTFDGEMRRRVWATILELNVQLSVDVTMPPLLAPEDYDTQPPSNFDDEDIEPAMEILPPAPSLECFTSSSLQIILYQCFPARLQIMRILNQCGRAQVYETALQLGNEILQACKELSNLFHKYFPRTKTATNPPTIFHVRLMDIILRRFLVNIHRPFAIHSINDPRFYMSRKISLDAALVMASHGDPPKDAAAASQAPYQDLQRLCLSGAGTFKGYLSLDVLMVISLELITQVEEETASQPPGSPGAPTTVDQMAQAVRVPLIQALERLSAHLYKSLEAGIPSMKRYCLLAGVLAQIQAMMSGEQAEWIHIRDAFLDSMKTCRTLLEQYISENPLPNAFLNVPPDSSNLWTPESGLGSSLESEFMFPYIGPQDMSFWDIPPFGDETTFDPPVV